MEKQNKAVSFKEELIRAHGEKIFDSQVKVTNGQAVAFLHVCVKNTLQPEQHGSNAPETCI